MFRLNEEVPFIDNLRYLVENGASFRLIGRVCGTSHTNVRGWHRGRKPKNEHALRVINLWARSLRQQLEGANGNLRGPTEVYRERPHTQEG